MDADNSSIRGGGAPILLVAAQTSTSPDMVPEDDERVAGILELLRLDLPRPRPPLPLPHEWISVINGTTLHVKWMDGRYEPNRRADKSITDGEKGKGAGGDGVEFK